MNDEQNYHFNTPEIVRGNWYQLEIGQNIGQNGEYIYYIKLNSQLLHEKENEIPREFSEHEMQFYAASDLVGPVAQNTKIRNVRFKTENNGSDDENSCLDWAADRDVFCAGDELDGSPIVTPGGLTECQDQCLNVGQNCVGVVLEITETEVVCHLHSEMNSCQSQEGAISSTKILYSCEDDSNCERSYVRMSDQDMIGRDNTYCGTETPPNFSSYGSAAQIIIQINSETHGEMSLKMRYNFTKSKL